MHISKLVAVSGIIVSASRKQAKGIELTLMCRHCHAKKYLKCKAGFGGAQIPKVCDANLSSYVLIQYIYVMLLEISPILENLEEKEETNVLQILT